MGRYRYRRRSKLSAPSALLYVLCIICAFYLFGIPILLGFTPQEAARWGPMEYAPEILSEWYMRTNNIGKISWRDRGSDEWHVVITQDGKVIAGNTELLQNVKEESP